MRRKPTTQLRLNKTSKWKNDGIKTYEEIVFCH